MPRSPWVKDLLLVGLCLTGVASLVLAYLQPNELRAENVAPRPSHQQQSIEAAARRVDDALAQEQRAVGVTPSDRADTLTIARRLSLALTGTIPSLEEIRALQSRDEADAIAWWVDTLLSDRRYADYFAERLARPLVGVGQGSLILYRRRRFVSWLSDQLAEGKTWDRVAAQMITGRGLWTQNPQTNFVTAAIKPDAAEPEEEVLAARVSRAFLGVRLDCAQCHDHPFDERWKQTDFQGLAAFFGRSKATFRGVQEVRGTYAYEDTASAEAVEVEPAVPFSTALLPAEGADRERLAAWVTHRENRAFSRAIANRVWALMLGRPLVEPVDDLPIDGSVPAVLDVLADDLVQHDFDLRRLVRVIAATETFARESRSASDEDALKTRVETWGEFPLTRLRPEQVVGALLQSASLTTVDHDSHVLVQLAGFAQENDFVRRYGDAGEDELEPDGGTIPQRLLMLNGEIVHERTKDNLVGNAATRIAVLTRDDATALEVAYLAVLSRVPTSAEAEYFEQRLAGTRGEARRKALADVYWALLNSTEFAWNH
jgi:hypothetical protein